MRPPLEYGDNFPVAPGHWNPAEPWRFPKHEVIVRRRGPFSYALPWITLGLGLTLGVLWMALRTDGRSLQTISPPQPALQPVQEPKVAPAVVPGRRPTSGSRARSEVA